MAGNKPLSLPTPTPAPTSSSPLELLVTQAAIDQAQTLGVLVSRVETLEAHLSQLQYECDHTFQQLAQAQGIPTHLTQQLELAGRKHSDALLRYWAKFTPNVGATH